jgi:agmatine deiminase
MKFKKVYLFLVFSLIMFAGFSQNMTYHMPDENAAHEATWLQWPHGYTYGNFYRNSLDQTWVNMTKALVESEKVFIIAYNNSEKARIINLLQNGGVSLDQITFFIHQNDDVWVRDNGPIFVYDETNQLTLLDWDFNGWGNDTPYEKCNLIPQLICTEINVPRIDLSAMVLEGGAVESDGKGTMMATRSSVTHASRNPNLSEAEIENYLTTYMGFTHFIWLDGLYGEEITDMHIDGFVKFANEDVILTMNQADLLYWGLNQSDIDLIYSAKNAENVPFQIEYLPLTVNDVTTEFGTNLGYKGSYANYYIANSVVLVPNYNDPSDAVANAIIQAHYPDRTVVGIDVRNLYENGGMVHCVTQQQPVVLNTTAHLDTQMDDGFYKLFPNPVQTELTIELQLCSDNEFTYSVVNQLGQLVKSGEQYLLQGKNLVQIDCKTLEQGIYFIEILQGNQKEVQKFVVE